MRTSVGFEPLQLVRINAAHDPRGEQSLKEAADPARALPGRGDPHQGLLPSAATAYLVTRLEPVSDSVRMRPGSGSATFIRYWRVRPPAVTVNRVIVPSPTPPDSTWKSENAGGRKCG